MTDELLLELPRGAQILSVGNQKDQLVLWALIDVECSELEIRHFLIVGTGHELRLFGKFLGKFLGTVLFHDAALVFHVFEIV
jgi:hypothetical protein